MSFFDLLNIILLQFFITPTIKEMSYLSIFHPEPSQPMLRTSKCSDTVVLRKMIYNYSHSSYSTYVRTHNTFMPIVRLCLENL